MRQQRRREQRQPGVELAAAVRLPALPRQLEQKQGKQDVEQLPEPDAGGGAVGDAAPRRVGARKPREARGELPHVHQRQLVRLPRGAAGTLPGGVQELAEAADQDEGDVRQPPPGPSPRVVAGHGHALHVRRRPGEQPGLAEFKSVARGLD